MAGPRQVSLTKGYVAIVDQSDYDAVASRKWRALVRSGTVYVACKIDGRTVLLHRFLMQPQAGLVVDHIDGDGLNNTRSNLRVCTHRENQKNRRRRKGGYSAPYKGVNFDQGRYRATIKTVDGFLHLGRFDSAIEAAIAYDNAAKKYHGEFACLNFPEGE